MYECISALRRYMNNVGVDACKYWNIRARIMGMPMGAQRHGCVVAWIEFGARMQRCMDAEIQVEACLVTRCTNLWMQDALCAWMQRYLDTEIQVEACLGTGCMDFWMQDALLHGCRDTGGSMPRYIDL